MFSGRVVTMFSLSFATLGLSVAIVNSPQGPVSLYQPAGSSLLPSPFNVSTLSTLNITASSDLGSGLNASMLEGQEVICRTPQQLTPPQISSCQDAFAQMPMNPALILQDPTYTYGPRHVAGLHPDWKLPIRWISSDGKCIIDLTQTGVPITHARYANLYAAAGIILSECVEAEHPPWAGEAFNMGVEENMQLVMRGHTSSPIIRCQNQPAAKQPISRGCLNVLQNMLASTEQSNFAVAGAGEPTAERLPRTFSDVGGECSITVDITAPDETASWYDIWQAAVALDGKCARSGKTGLARFLGVNRKLTFELKKEAP